MYETTHLGIGLLLAVLATGYVLFLFHLSGMYEGIAVFIFGILVPALLLSLFLI